MTKWKWSSSFLCKKISSFRSQKSYSFYFGFFQVSPAQLSSALSLCRLTQKSGNLQSEDVHLFASSGGARRVTLGWMGAKESPEPWQWGTNWQRLKLLQKDIFHTVCSVNLNSHVRRVLVLQFSISTIGVTHQLNTRPWYPRAIPRHIW